MASIEIKKDGFYIDGKKTKIISGAMHYFRVFPEYWENRLKTLKELGCNCVETYTAWNLHEKREGEFDFSGILDLKKYIETAKKLGLYLVLRPGPYICSECDMGGLPWWLLKYDDIELRTYNLIYLKKVRKYLEKICEIVKPELITNGGNIIMIQVENEFGAFGNDKKYLETLKGYYKEFGMDCPLVTSDWAERTTLENGTIDGVYATVNYRWDSITAQKNLKEFHPQDMPGGTMELWNGSSIHFNKKCVKRNLDEVATSVKGALAETEYMNLYMYHGGTNFGFFNGSIYDGGRFEVQAQTYDVQTPLGEYGNKTEKYYLEQKIICDYLGIPIKNETEEPCLSCYGEARLTGVRPLFDMKNECGYSVRSEKILPMEKFDLAHGCIAYGTQIQTGDSGALLLLPSVHDFLKVYVDGKLVGSAERDDADRLDLAICKGEHTLILFVEEFGRINFGRQIKDYKGLTGDVVLFDKETQAHVTLKDFTVDCYPLEKFGAINGVTPDMEKPNCFKFTINLKPQNDTYLKLEGFVRGAAYINGFNLGRYWNVGPQRTLYVPKSLLKDGENEIMVFESCTYGFNKKVALIDKEIIDGYTD